MLSVSSKKATIPRMERARWEGRKRRRRDCFLFMFNGAAFRLFLSKSYLECETMNS